MYDDIYRLTNVNETNSGTLLESFNYDNIGNRINNFNSKTGSGANKSRLNSKLNAYYAGQKMAGNNPYKNAENQFLKLRAELKEKEEIAKQMHYDRNIYNDVPDNITPNNALNFGWEIMSADKYHQDGVKKGFENTKWVSSDGKSEVVFTYDSKIVTEVNNMGTYNFYAGELGTSRLHFKYDVGPWREWGSGLNDTNSLR